ncbi:hypothetical protein BG006_001279 [Podila minutissima]|uniref:Galactose oxidase n=1 Tax=Podila minutissima TaxID=64525 RepID=A0A9P5SB23_9FUNG|nr:hypothetical protein BG006_001279 [Podila minutissima]
MTIRKRNILSTSSALTLISCLSLAAAQAPSGVRRMGYTQLDDKLFIQGGFDTSSSPQFFSLDLSTSWSDAIPAWTKLRDGQSTTHLALTNISGGGKDSILAISGMDAPVFFSAYDIESNTWANIPGVARNPYKELEGHAAVTDPISGLVYIVGGFTSGTTAYNSLSVYNPGTKSMVSQQAAASLATSLIDAGAVWSTKRNTLLTFGGSLAYPNNPAAVLPAVVNEYDPNSKSWSVMETSGDVPSARLDHCMVATEDGSKIVVFGGTDGVTFNKDIYILDLEKAKWKRGTDSGTPRTRMACGLHSAQLIAWGGSSGVSRNTIFGNTPVIYDLNSDKWVGSYDSSKKLSSGGVGSIVGTVVGVVAAVALVGLVIYRKRKQRLEEDAYHADAIAAAAVGADDADNNVKVSLGDRPLHSNTPYFGAQHGNDYPLSKMEINDSHAMEAARDRYTKENESSGYHGGSAELMTSPVPSHYYPQQVQSPAATYQQGTPYLNHTNAGSAYSNSNNPFENYSQYPNSSTGGGSPGSNPFSNAHATSATSEYYPSSAATTPYMQHSQYQGPFEQVSSPPMPPQQQAQVQVYPNYTTYAAGQTMSPSPGARAPQVIPEEGRAPQGYVPPPSL